MQGARRAGTRASSRVTPCISSPSAMSVRATSRSNRSLDRLAHAGRPERPAAGEHGDVVQQLPRPAVVLLHHVEHAVVDARIGEAAEVGEVTAVLLTTSPV